MLAGSELIGAKRRVAPAVYVRDGTMTQCGHHGLQRLVQQLHMHAYFNLTETDTPTFLIAPALCLCRVLLLFFTYVINNHLPAKMSRPLSIQDILSPSPRDNDEALTEEVRISYCYHDLFNTDGLGI